MSEGEFPKNSICAEWSVLKGFEYRNYVKCERKKEKAVGVKNKVFMTIALHSLLNVQEIPKLKTLQSELHDALVLKFDQYRKNHFLRYEVENHMTRCRVVLTTMQCTILEKDEEVHQGITY